VSGDLLAAARFDFVWLASQSERRRQLLDQIGVSHRLLVADADEDVEALEAERVGELPLDYVVRVTRAKLQAARERLRRRQLDDAPIVCADTTVAIGRSILGKPVDADDARRMLRRLSDRSHRVLTAVAVTAGRRTTLATSISHVHFATWPAASIDAYVASGEPFGKAGGYAIQGAAAAWVAHVAGSHTGIMGLPLHETAQLLRRAGVAMAP